LLIASGLIAILRYIKDYILSIRLFKLIKYQEKKRGPYDVLYFHEASMLNRMAKKFHTSGTKTFLYCYDTPDKFMDWETGQITYDLLHKLFFYFIAKASIRITRQYIDKVFVLDSAMKKKVLDFYQVSPTIIRSGIDLSTFHSKRSVLLKSRYNLPHNSIIISNVSRFVPYRRIHDIIKSYCKLSKTCRKNAYVYINAFDEDKEYFSLIMNKYSELIYPLGKIIIDTQYPSSDDELAQIYNSSDIFVFPNENQTWGNAVLEAMACGVCSIVSDGCGIHEIVHNEIDGYIYNCGDVGRLTDILSYLINDSFKRISIGNNATNYIQEEFSWDNWASEHIKIFGKHVGTN
jgi:glycosyltransferase involved in cell wall biosynthesis